MLEIPRLIRIFFLMKNEKSLCYPHVSCVLPVSVQYKFSVPDLFNFGVFCRKESRKRSADFLPLAHCCCTGTEYAVTTGRVPQEM